MDDFLPRVEAGSNSSPVGGDDLVARGFDDTSDTYRRERTLDTRRNL